jgi:tetratricopeptide (TPR) repeat protein
MTIKTMAAAFALGLLAKPMVVTLPFVLVLLDVWPLDRVARLGWRRVVVEKLPLFALSAAAAVVTFLVQSRAGAVQSLEHQSVGARVANAVVSYAAYVWKTVWPTGLAVFYPPVDTFSVPTVLAAAALLAALTALACWQGRARPYLLVGWLWYLGTLVPVIGIVHAGDQAMADRFTYVPGIGLAIRAAWAAGELARRDARSRTIATAIAVVVVLAWCVRTREQLATWRDSKTLYEHAIAVTADNHLAHGNLGLLLLDEKKVPEAMEHFRAAVRARPTAPKAHVNLGVGLSAIGQPDAAFAEYQEAARLDPALPVAHYNLGLSFAERGRLDEARAEYETAIRLDPDYAPPHVNLGLVLANQGRFADAIVHYRNALALDPGLPAAYNNLAVALERTGATDEAVEAYRTAVRMLPDDPRARFNLGAVLAGTGKPAEAIVQYREVVRLDPSVPEGYAALGEALEATGDRVGALVAYRQALARRADWPAVRDRVAALETPAGER